MNEVYIIVLNIFSVEMFFKKYLKKKKEIILVIVIKFK